MENPRPPSDVTVEDIQGFFDRMGESSEPVCAEEVAEALDCPPQTVRNSLEELAERGTIRSKQVGDSIRVWWKPEEPPSDGQQQSEEQFSAFVTAVKDYAIFTLGPDGTVVSWNEGAERIKGFSEDEIVGEHFSAFYTDDAIADDVPEKNLEIAATEGRVEDEGWRVRADGSRFWANVTITAIRDDEDTLQGFTKVTRDMTDRREYEQDLEEQAERLEHHRDDLEQELDDIFERIDDAFYALDDEFRYEYVNERAEDHLGKPAQQLIGRKPWEVFDIDESHPFFEKLRMAMASQEPASYERYSDLLEIWEIVRIYPSESGLSVYFRDITERKERELELARARDFLERTERIASVGGWEIDVDTLDVFWTEHLFEILEVSYEEEPPLDEALDVYHEDDRPVVEGAVEEALDAGEPFDIEVRFLTPSGEVRWLRVKGNPEVEDGEIISLRGAVQDITDRKERERELEQYERIIESVNEGVYVVDGDRNFQWVNEAYAEMLGYSREELIGENAAMVVDEEVLREADAVAEEEGYENVPRMDIELVTKDGDRVPVEVAATVLPEGGRDGWFRAGVVRDITERKEYERRLEEFVDDLEASNERLEQFAYAASHDLQEPLRMVSSYLQLIGQRYGDALDEDGKEFLEFAVDGADRMREMIEGLLEYSRVETEGEPFEPVDLNSVLDDVLADLQLQIDERDAEIAVEDLPCVQGDAGQLRQVFQNLLDNAIEYSGDEPPRIDISAERDGENWVVSVRDEGIGIDPADTDRIFEVFQRLHTRDEHSGTGIGLALCQRIIERHGGEIWVESEPGDGSTFSIMLPAVQSQAN